jgi:hypothetical protein
LSLFIIVIRHDLSEEAHLLTEPEKTENT